MTITRTVGLAVLATCGLAATEARESPGPVPEVAAGRGALDGHRYRVLVSTDVGGTDPDDFQSLVHLLVYADSLDLEGLVSSPYGPGRKEHILEVIDHYARDYARLRTYSDRYPTPDALRAMTRQGATGVAPRAGVRQPTEGSEWIVRSAREDDPRPLHVLVWGGIEDLAQALHDAPDILPKLRVYWIGGPNKKWSTNAYQHIVDHHPELWIIEANATYRGWFVGGEQSGDWGNTAFVTKHVAGRGALGEFFSTHLGGTIKMGDTPSVGWLLRGDPADPTAPGWGGRFVRAWERPHVVFDRLTTAADQMEQFGVLELALPVLAGAPAAPEAFMEIENQSLEGDFGAAGSVRFRFSPKGAKTYTYRIRSNVPALHGKSGEITAIPPPPSAGRRPSPRLPNWWTDDPAPELAEGPHIGAMTVSRWRVVFLRDFAERMERCRGLLAFPGAEGFGAHSKGGRGGKVLHVTNLNDSGEGSLRWAVEREGPRTVVFDVSGNITLEARLSIENPFVTIAGQTAPGDGICMRGETLRVATHDVVIRYLRVRLGDGMHGQGSLQGKDAISISEGRDIIVDHCSASWSLDEVLSSSTRDPTLSNVTVQWCFITEGLDPSNHGYGSLIRGTGGARYSYIKNLYAHHRGRSPRPGNYDSNPHTEDPRGLLLDFRNNVIYNWGGGHAGYNQDETSVTRLNYVGNYLIPGASSENNGIAYSTGSPYNRSYFAGNYYDGKQPDDQWRLVRFRETWTEADIRDYKRTEPFETGPITRMDAPTAFEHVLENGGATLPRRDAVDERVVGSVRNRTGRIIKSQDEVGGWPELKSASAPQDSDRDGMPDAWEKAHGLNPDDAEDRNEIGEGGYTRLESYLNELCERQ